MGRRLHVSAGFGAGPGSLTETVDYPGRYGISGSPGLEIIEQDGTLFLQLPGAPKRYAAPLRVESEDRLAIAAGPLANVPLRFRRNREVLP